nr:hypothetical protein [Mucilaginibacter sp. X5P1]
MSNTRTIVLQFYRPLFAINLVFSLYLIYESSEIDYGQGVFLKLFSYLFLFGYQYFSKSNTYFYYRNAGYSMKRLYAYVAILDLAIYSLLYSFFYLLHYAFAHA